MKYLYFYVGKTILLQSSYPLTIFSVMIVASLKSANFIGLMESNFDESATIYRFLQFKKDVCFTPAYNRSGVVKPVRLLIPLTPQKPIVKL